MSDIFGSLATARAGQLQGQDQRRQKALADRLQEYMIASKLKSQGIEDKYKTAQLEDALAQAAQRRYQTEHPKPQDPAVGTPEWAASLDTKARIEAKYRQTPSQYQFVPGADQDGNPSILRGNNRTGVLEPTGQRGKPSGAGGAGGGVQGAVNTARITTAAGQAKTADQFMREFEDGVLSGADRISPMGMMMAKTALNDKGSVLSTGAEATLNKVNPRLAQYVRAAKTMAASERLITPRGGSNALMQAEAFLSGAGPNATPEQIEQVRGFRGALTHGLDAGTGASAGATRAAGTGTNGNTNRSGPSSPRALSASDKAKAKSDPGFAQYLTDKGFKAGRDF